MKKVLIGFIALLLSNCALSQTSKVNEKLSFALPKQAARITDKGTLRSTPLRSQGLINRFELSKGQLYNIGNVNLYLAVDNSAPPKNYLETERDNYVYENHLGHSTWTIGELKELNNYRYLPATRKRNNNSYLLSIILAVNKPGTSYMAAYLEYDEKYREEGEKVIEDFLKSMKFK